MDVKQVLSKLVSYFLKGLLYTVPLALTVYIIYRLFLLIDGLIPVLLGDLIPINHRGLGILLVIALVTGVGIMGSSFLAKPIKNYFTRLIDSVPLVKTIYSSIRDLMSAFVGEKKRFDRPVLVKTNKESGMEKLGFITAEDLSSLGIGDEKIAVYLPHSYNFSGNLFIVPQENVTLLNVNSSEVMKFIVSGGVTEIQKTEKLNS
jgi:uncharacterized membrane protein